MSNLIADFPLTDLLSRAPLRRRGNVLEFVNVDDDYCDNFGDQWNRYREMQIDSLSKNNLSHTRFYSETGWNSADLKGKLLLDVGCGAGRFAEIALEAGARVVAVDLSAAVMACAKTLERFPADNYLILRANLFDLPLAPGSFDGVYSLGVLQHTPDPLLAVRELVRFVKPGGELATWIYCSTGLAGLINPILPKNIIRAIVSRRWSNAAKLRLAKILTALGFPFGWALSWFGRTGERLSIFLPYAARHHWARGDLRKQWDCCVMDTYDWIGPQYDLPQTEHDVMKTMAEAGLIEVQRTPARGMAIKGRRPA